MCCFGFQEYIQFAGCGHSSTTRNQRRYIACENVPAENKKDLIWARPAAVSETSVPCDDFCDYFSTVLPIIVNLSCKACKTVQPPTEMGARSLSPLAASDSDKIFSDQDGETTDVTQPSDVEGQGVIERRVREPLPTQSEAYASFLVEVMQYVPGKSGRRALPPQAWIAPARRHRSYASRRASPQSPSRARRGGSSWRRGDPY